MTILITLTVLIVVMLLGVPIGLAFFAASLYLIVSGNYDPGFLMPFGVDKLNSIILLCIPLFVIAGGLMNHGGIGAKLVSAVEDKVAKIKGGLGIVAALVCGIFGAISGSAAACMASIGPILIPKLTEKGYSRGFTAALIASTSLLGILIPPSAMMILFAWASNTSVLACFLAGIGPGVLLIVMFSTICIIYANNSPDVLPYTQEEIDQMKAVKRIKRDVNGKRVWGSMPALLMPVIILGTIYSGLLTTTESAAIAIVYAIPVGLFIYKELDRKSLATSFINAGITTGSIMVMLFAIMVLSRMFTMENLPQQVLGILMGISDNKYVIMLIINLFLVILGMLMDDNSAILLSTPLLLPVATAIGVSPVHYSAIMAVNLGMGLITPPCAPLLYMAAGIAETNLKEMWKPTLVFICCAWLPAVLLVTFVPAISMAIPQLILGI